MSGLIITHFNYSGCIFPFGDVQLCINNALRKNERDYFQHCFWAREVKDQIAVLKDIYLYSKYQLQQEILENPCISSTV